VICLVHVKAMQLPATDTLLPVRIVAGIAFIAMICAYVYVLRHLRKIEKNIVADDLVPSELGPRNNMVLMVCLIPLIATALLLYLVIKT
jgi:hypothetical protein